MNRVIGALCVLGLLMTNPLTAQISDETKITVQVIEEERKTLVMGALDLTAEQQAAFSPMYDAYLEDLAVLNDHRRHLIQEYLEKYKALSDEDAKRLLVEFITIDQLELDLHMQYTMEFGKMLPPRVVLRLWQIENKLDLMLFGQLAKDIPLVK
jgi:hypothetical protein